MSTLPRLLAILLVISLAPLTQGATGTTELFDGKTLTGWEGDLQWWRVQDGVITGGSTSSKIPENQFLATTRSFQNFE